ncbi:reverse transcriptase domain-containing protein [Tanacetum coccineum]
MMPAILEQAQMLNCNPYRTPIDTEKKLGHEGSPVTDPTLYRSLAGSLQYITFTRPDLSYAVLRFIVIRVKQKQLNLGVGTEQMIFNIDSAMKHSYSNDDTCFSIDVINEILEEDFDALLDEGSKILHSIEGTILEEEIFSEFDEFWQ